MKKIILFFFVLICFYNTQAQNTFEKVIDTLGSNFAPCIKETFDGGYVYCGQSNYNGNDAMVVKLDSIGTIEWAKIYSGPSIEGALYIEQTPDSGYMVNGLYDGGSPNAKTWLLKLNQFGDTLWTKTFSLGLGGTIPSQNNSMASLHNNVYGLTGHYNSPSINSAYFIACTSNGFLLANKIYTPSPYAANSNAIDRTYDDGFIMAGGTRTSLLFSDVYLIRTNLVGDTLWSRTYDHSDADAALDVKQTTDSGFIVAGIHFLSGKNNIWLIKTDAAGDTIWTKSYFSTIHQVVYSIEQTTDGGYIMTGDESSFFGRYLHLTKTNSIGDTLWTRIFNPGMDCSGYFVRQTKDGGYIISGISYGAYIIKTDSLGNVASSTGVAELNNPFVFSVYPNPSAGIVNIAVKGFPKSTGTIEVYNLVNECVYTCSINNNTTEQLNLSHLPNGIYAVRLRTKNKVAAQKIIIQK